MCGSRHSGQKEKPNQQNIKKKSSMVSKNFVFISYKTSDTHEHVVLIYFAQTEQTTIQPQQAETKWFSREELEENKYGITAYLFHAVR